VVRTPGDVSEYILLKYLIVHGLVVVDGWLQYFFSFLFYYFQNFYFFIF
jgi:hypothetical protein